jgi:hypothetical protein
MQLATLETISQVEAVTKELKNRGFRKKEQTIEGDLRLKLKLSALLQNMSGCLHRKSARSMDSSSGRMARQCTNPCGTVESQINQAKKPASYCTLSTPKCWTTA